MNRKKKELNVEIGSRLQEVRENMGYTQEETAVLLDICSEQYRKIESGYSGITLNKIIVLNNELNIDPTFLLTGKQQNIYDIEYVLANSSQEQKQYYIKAVFNYIERMMQT